MKRFNWLLIGFISLCLAMVLLAGCVSKSEYEALQVEQATLVDENNSLKAELQEVQADLTSAQADLTRVQADYDTLKADNEKLKGNYETATKELAQIKEVYPPRDFSSLKELQDWLLANDVSERPAATTAEGLYSKALEIQEDALKDGYIISAWIDYYAETQMFYVNCTAVADGYVWMWSPETDEPLNFSDASGLLKLK